MDDRMQRPTPNAPDEWRPQHVPPCWGRFLFGDELTDSGSRCYRHVVSLVDGQVRSDMPWHVSDLHDVLLESVENSVAHVDHRWQPVVKMDAVSIFVVTVALPFPRGIPT